MTKNIHIHTYSRGSRMVIYIAAKNTPPEHLCCVFIQLYYGRHVCNIGNEQQELSI